MLSHGRDQLSIPGPSVMPDVVLQAMQRPSPNIYDGEMIDIANSLYADLQRVACTQADAVIYIGNGHAAWEAALTNTLSRGDKVLALACGRFTVGWADMARALGLEVEILDFGGSQPIDTHQVLSRLEQDDGSIKAVITTQTDTSTSVRADISQLRQTLDTCSHPALLMIDCIASLGCEPYLPDQWGVDVTVAACQKGLMTPAGISFNFVGPKAWQAHQTAGLRSPYWDWEPRVHGPVFHQKFCGTPPTHHLFALRTALDLLLEEGMENVWRRHKALASAVWAATEAWGNKGPLALNVKDPNARSTAVTTILSGDVSAGKLRRWCEENTGLTLGVGLPLGSLWGKKPDNVFRIGHMGHLNATMLMGALGSLDIGLKACGIQHGEGALQQASKVLANELSGSGES